MKVTSIWKILLQIMVVLFVSGFIYHEYFYIPPDVTFKNAICAEFDLWDVADTFRFTYYKRFISKDYAHYAEAYIEDYDAFNEAALQCGHRIPDDKKDDVILKYMKHYIFSDEICDSMCNNAYSGGVVYLRTIGSIEKGNLELSVMVVDEESKKLQYYMAYT